MPLLLIGLVLYLDLASWSLAHSRAISRIHFHTAIGDTKRSNVDHVGRPTLQLIQRIFDHSDLILLPLINHTLLEHLERFADRTDLGVSLHLEI